MAVPDVDDRVNAAIEKFEAAGDITHDFANLPAGSYITTESGPLPSLAEFLQINEDAIGGLPALEADVAALQDFQSDLVDPAQGATLIPFGGVTVDAALKFEQLALAIPTNGVADGAPTLQAYIDATVGKVVRLPSGDIRCESSIDARGKRIVGQGSGNIGVSQTRINFVGTAGFFNSGENNHGYALEKMEIYGSGAKATNGQILVNMTGQNYPMLVDVRIWQGDIGLKLAKGTTVECNYGKFFRIDINQCRTGVDVGLSTPAASNTHHFYGGRLWDNETGVRIPLLHSNIDFFGTAFEANDLYGIDSEGINVGFLGCRFENPGATNVLLRENAGNHWFSANHWSSGFSVEDRTLGGKCYGSDFMISSVAPVGTLGSTVTSSGNLLGNGAFSYDRDADGVPEPWIKGSSTAGTHVVSLVAGDFGNNALQINNTSGDNLRIYQQIKVVKGMTYTLEWRGKTSTSTWQMRVSSSSSAGTEYGNISNTESAYTRKAIRFTATSDTLFVSIYLAGTTARIVTVDYVTLTAGIMSGFGPSEKPIGEFGGVAQENIGTAGGTWNTAHLTMGAYHLWMDATGRLRVKSGAPTSDTDGTVVGAQT